LDNLTTLPIAPRDLIWLVLGLVGATQFAWGLRQAAVPGLKTRWPSLWRWIASLGNLPVMLLLVLWAGLFLLTLYAAYVGLWQATQPAEGTASGSATFGFGLGALVAALLGAPFVIWGTWLKYQTVRFQKEGHMTDRINTAVEQLGAEKTVKRREFRPKLKTKDGKSVLENGNPVEDIRSDGTPLGDWSAIEETVPNIEVRIGAILSLERIAQDSTIHDKGRDHVRVMEILCAYVRENSNTRKPEDFPEPEWEPLKDDATAEEGAAHETLRTERFGGGNFMESKAWNWAQGLPKPRADVEQALQVIGRRTAEQRRVESAWPEVPGEDTVWPFDLTFRRLPDTPGEAALSAAELEAYRVRLKGWKDRIRSYKGYRLDLTGANLQGAQLSPKRPDASDAVFAGAILTGARMEGADLAWARMEGADLAWARMEGADLYEARMEAANLYEARMEGADLTWARMEGAYLYEARMEGANLSRARMDPSTDWTAALLRGAAVQFVDFTTTPISADQVNDLFGDGSTRLPDHIPRPDHWPTWELPWDGKHAFDDEWTEWRKDPEGYRPPEAPVKDSEEVGE